MRSRAEAEALDAADPLAPFRERFVVAEPDLIYLDGNSLGRLPVSTRARMEEVTERWATGLVRGWDEWLDAPRRAGDALAPVIGAEPGEVIVTDSVTVNLYKLAFAAHREGPIVAERRGFPTDRYVLAGLAEQRGVELRLVDEPEVDGAGLVVWSHVDYRSGTIANVPGLTARCREAGVPLIWDLCHSAGALPVGLYAAGAELAVGCTYKYLNAGPGGPAFLYVARELQPRLRSPIWGWFAQRDQFDMDRDYDPQPGIERFLAGTPPVMAVAAAEEGARLTAEAGVQALRAKSIAQLELLVECLPEGVELASPREPERRGSHVAIRHPDARRLNERLLAANVIGDFRTPDVIRLAVAPLYTRFVDVWEAMERLAQELAALRVE
jgi:kynureninase